jgi:hypothetical protein
MCSRYFVHALILSLDAYNEKGLFLWDLLNNEAERQIADDVIHSSIRSFTTNFSTMNQWSVACILLIMDDGDQRYAEIACRTSACGDPIVFLAAKRGSVIGSCPHEPIIFAPDSFVFPHLGFLGLSMETMAKCESMAHFGTPWPPSDDSGAKWTTLYRRRDC